MRLFLTIQRLTWPSDVLYVVLAFVVLLAGGLSAVAQDAPPEPVSPEEVEPQAAEASQAPEVPQASEPPDLKQMPDTELASTQRFEVELEALLLPDGQLDTTTPDAFAQLENLTTRCGILANSTTHPESRLTLLSYQARGLAALARLEPISRSNTTSRLDQLTQVANRIAAVDHPMAAASADYWSLLANLARQASEKTSPAQRRAQAEERLAEYITHYKDDASAADYLLDTRLSLAQLMDSRGAQRDVVKQLNLVGKLPADSPRLVEVKRLRDSIARLGRPIAFESISTQLTPWRSTDFLGKPVLIHVYADGVESSVRMIDVISRSIVQGTLSGIAVVSLRVGDPVAGSVSPPWPTLPVPLEPGSILDQLGVTALPTLAWLDEQGRLAAIGTTSAVLDQLQVIKPKTPDTEVKDDANAKDEASPPTNDPPDQVDEQTDNP